jgi:Tfp pilus assembly protein PilN
MRLKKVWDTIWKILTFNLIEGVVLPKKCLSLSIEKGAVSVAYGTLFLSKPRIKEFRKYSFDEGKYAGPENLASAASRSIDGLKASRAEIILSVPREFLVVRTAELPLVVKENIISVMSYELDRLTPFTSNEAMYDFKIHDEEEGKLKVIIAAIRTDVLKPYLDALKEKNIHPARITVSAASLGTLCSIFENGKDTLCVSITEGGYEGCLTKKAAVSSIFYGTFSGHDRESNLDQVAEDIVPLLDQLKGKGISPVIFLCPGEGYAMLQDKIGVPVRILKKDDIQSMFKATGKDDIIFTPLGGLLEAILPKANGFNLISKGAKEIRKVPLAITIILLSIVIAMIIPYLVVPLEIQKNRLRAIDAHIASRKGEIKKIEALKKEIDAVSGDISRIKEFKESRPMALNIMKELTTLLPNTVWLTRTRITEESVEIEGYASVATEILTKLEQSKLFQKVEFTSPTIRDTRMNSDRFVIKMELEGFEKKQAEANKK